MYRNKYRCVQIYGLVFSHISLPCHFKELINSDSEVEMSTPSIRISVLKYYYSTKGIGAPWRSG